MGYHGGHLACCGSLYSSEPSAMTNEVFLNIVLPLALGGAIVAYAVVGAWLDRRAEAREARSGAGAK
jgi:hypothetical protein